MSLNNNKSAQLIALTLEGSSEAALLLNLSGQILYRNEVAQNLLFFSNNNGKQQQDCDHVSSLIDNFAEQQQNDDKEEKESLLLWDDVVSELLRIVNEKKTTTTTVTKRTMISSSSQPVSVKFTLLGDDCPEDESSSNTKYICAHITKITTNENCQDNRLLQAIKESADASFDAMFTITETGRILLVNQAAVTLFGYSNDEFIGSNISMICGQEHAVHHDEYLKRYLQTGITKIIGKKREVYAKKRDGTEFPIELGIKEKFVTNGSRIFFAFIQDRTQLKQHLMELQHRENLTKGLINASFDPMFQINEGGKILLANDAACDLFGYSQKEFLSSNISIICGKEHAAQHDKYIERYLKYGDKRVIGLKRNVVAQCKDGKEIEIELSVQEVICGVTGERTFCGYIHDMTQQNLDKEQLRRNNELITQTFFGKAATASNDNNNNTTVGESSRAERRERRRAARSMPG